MGVTDVDALLESMSYRQLLEWRAYEAIEPFGRRRADFHAAMIRQAIENIMRSMSEDADPVDLEDVMPRFGESEASKQRRQAEKARKATEKIMRKLKG